MIEVVKLKKKKVHVPAAAQEQRGKVPFIKKANFHSRLVKY